MKSAAVPGAIPVCVRRGALAALAAWAIVSNTACTLAYRPGLSDRPPPQPAIPAPAEAGATAPSPPVEATGGAIHVVEAGQTVWRIARAYGIDVDLLMRANGITDPARVEVGAALIVPGAKRTLEVAPFPSPPALPPDVDRVAPSTAVAFAWPVRGPILSRFGAPRGAKVHRGLDIRGDRGETVAAARDGRIILAGETPTGYGRTVVIDHGDGYRTLYAHNDEILVRVGDEVARGAPIARVGRTGNATAEHVHFEIRRGNEPIDPLPYLDGVLEASK